MRKRRNTKAKEVVTLYSYEIEKFLKDRNYSLTAKECAELIDTNANTQINMVKYLPFNNEFHVSTNDGYFFIFKTK